MSPFRVCFIEPPVEHRRGGIDVALNSLAESLRDVGIDVFRPDAGRLEDIQHADVVHFHGIWQQRHILARRMCSRLSKPWVVSPHGMLEPWAMRQRAWKKIPYFRLVERPSMRQARALLATSAAEARTLSRWFISTEVKVLPLGVVPPRLRRRAEVRRVLGWQDDERVVLFLSRLHMKKGLHILIDAWCRLSNARARLVIIGDGDKSYIEPLRQMAARHGGVRIEWLGPIWGDARWPFLEGADLLCLPTFSENFGLVVLEALSVGTHVLTTPHTPWSESEDLPIAVCEPNVRSLTDALRHALTLPAPTDVARCERSASIVRQYGWPKLALQYAAFYRRLCTA